MTENFTERTRKVLGLARQEALRTQSEFIGTEHALIALVVEGGGVAAKILKNLGIDLEKVREESRKLITPSSSPTVTLGQLPFSPRLKRVLELAWEFACRMGQDVIGTEHLLVGIAREREGVAYQIFMNLKVDPLAIENMTVEVMGADVSEPKGQGAHNCTRCNGSGKEPKIQMLVACDLCKVQMVNVGREWKLGYASAWKDGYVCPTTDCMGHAVLDSDGLLVHWPALTLGDSYVHANIRGALKFKGLGAA